MKKSECFRLAQIAVVESARITSEEKLDILAELMAGENLQRFVEEQKEKGACENEPI